MASFMPLDLCFDLSFWSTLNERKLNHWMLDDQPRDIIANFPYFFTGLHTYVLSFDHHSFNESSSSSVKCRLHLFNTAVEFENIEKNEILKKEGDGLWDVIESGSWVNDPRSLLKPVLFMFADLKEFKYRIIYCTLSFNFPENPHWLKFSDPPKFEVPESFDLKSFESLPCLYSKVGGTWKICSFNEMDSLNSDDTWLICSSLGQPNYPNVLNIELRNLLIAIAYRQKKWSSIKLAVFKRNEPEFSTAISWIPEFASRGKSVPSFQLKKLKFELKSTFSKEELMVQAADLNAKLMRWRLVPDLNLDKFSKKVLILGAGTLGCNLARGIMGWGIRHMTFIDCGSVNPSNPLRQSLYSIDDIGKPKAQAAAESLKKIFPAVVVDYRSFKIPMPGHGSGGAQENVKLLLEAIEGHDIVFLATDSRESRWLPTLLCSYLKKLTITVALGFDSFLIMRHGYLSSEVPSVSETCVHGSDLGCYFCSDVTGPGNSTANRTLDQQCTISRAGLSSISCGLAVELMASVLQHPEGHGVPAKLIGTDDESTVLGAAPHQIRGFISSYKFMTATVKKSPVCSACGVEVMKRVPKMEEFINDVLDDPRVLENICGLTKLQEDAAAIEDAMTAFSDDSEGSAI